MLIQGLFSLSVTVACKHTSMLLLGVPRLRFGSGGSCFPFQVLAPPPGPCCCGLFTAITHAGFFHNIREALYSDTWEAL